MIEEPGNPPRSSYGLASRWMRDKNRILVDEFADQVFPLIAANL
jgi:hypothetical protein